MIDDSSDAAPVPSTASAQARQSAAIAVAAAEDKLATDVVVIDVASLLPLSDIFIICTAHNERQLVAVVDEIEDRLREQGYKAHHREGKSGDDWILISYPDIAVHVQLPSARAYYRLESLWNDCPRIDLSALVGDRL